MGFTYTKHIIFPHAPEIMGRNSLTCSDTHQNKNEAAGTHEKCSMALQHFVNLSSTNNVILSMKISMSYAVRIEVQIGN